MFRQNQLKKKVAYLPLIQSQMIEMGKDIDLFSSRGLNVLIQKVIWSGKPTRNKVTALLIFK